MRAAGVREIRLTHQFVVRYFAKMPVLLALDLNHDLVISPDEILNAPTALRTLDANQDGALDQRECGSVFDRPVFMRLNPVLRALDSDRDDVISAIEIDNAALALRRLDKNHDGELTAYELVPDWIVGEEP